jgi:hypothetical protein
MLWKKSMEFPHHFISEYGDVVSIKRNAVMKGFVDYDNYRAYKLIDANGKKRQVSAHRLVALAFLGSPNLQNSQVRHLNGSKIYCHYKNLAWGDAASNRLDTQRHGTSSVMGARNPKSKLKDEDIVFIRQTHKDIKEGRNKIKVQDLADMYGVHIATICGIASGKTWRHIPFSAISK